MLVKSKNCKSKDYIGRNREKIAPKKIINVAKNLKGHSRQGSASVAQRSTTMTKSHRSSYAYLKQPSTERISKLGDVNSKFVANHGITLSPHTRKPINPVRQSMPLNLNSR